MNDRVRLKRELMQLRLTSGLTQEEVADLLGYATGQFISNWERGQSIPPVTVIHNLAKIYRTPADSLFELVLAATLESLIERMTKSFHEQ